MTRVLLAEDDPGTSKALAARLSAMGLDVVTAHDGAHALFLMHKQPADLLITDVWMPAGNGMAMGEMIRDDARLREIPIIFMTSDSSHKTRRRIASLGGRYVAKGDDLWTQLEPICRELLDLEEPAQINEAA